MNSKTTILIIFIIYFQSIIVIGNTSEIDSLIQKIEFTDNNILKCDLFNNIASEYLVSNPAEAIFYANKAFQLSIRLNYEKGLATSYLIQGRANESLSNYEKALDYLFSALFIQKQLNNEIEIAEINYRLGRICKTIGNYENALEYCLNALRICKKHEDPLRTSNVYNTMGSIYKYLGDNDQSLDYYFKCMEIQKENREDGVSAWIYNNIGIVYMNSGRYDEALKYYDQSLEIRRNNKDSLRMASSFNNIAAVLLDQEKLDSAYVYLRKSLVIKEKKGDLESLVNIYLNLSEYYHKSKDYIKALDYASRVLSITQQLKLARPTSLAYVLLKDIYKARGQFDKALDYQIRYTQINDSIYNTEKSMRIAQLAMLYDSELRQVEHDFKDQRKWFINMAIYAALFFGLIFLFSIYVNLKSKFSRNKLTRINLELEKEKLAIDLESKNRELTRNIIYLTEKNELLFNQKKTLQELKRNMKEENKACIQSVINKMEVSYNNKMWDEFDMHFTNVHEKFYENMNNDHPDLSLNEKRLAAFLKLNMVTKEISMITKQSIHSITVARTRLRKKLDLSNTDINLVSYLAKY